jgi:hypothetical protein
MQREITNENRPCLDNYKLSWWGRDEVRQRLGGPEPVLVPDEVTNPAPMSSERCRLKVVPRGRETADVHKAERRTKWRPLAHCGKQKICHQQTFNERAGILPLATRAYSNPEPMA